MSEKIAELTGDDPRLVTMGDVVAFVTYPTAGAVFTSEGAVLIDGPMSPVSAGLWRRYVEKRAPIKYHILCEHHEDHTACSSLMGADILLSSEMTASELMETAARSDDEMRETLRGWGRNQYHDENLVSSYRFRFPDMTYGRRLNFVLGGKRFVVFEAPGHTLGSSIVHAVDDRVAFVADNVFPGTCAPAAQSSDPWAWLQTLALLEGLDAEWYVPGHGNPCGREGIQDQRIGLLSFIDIIRDARREGVPREEAIDAAVAAGFGTRPSHRGSADTPPGLFKIVPAIQRESAARVYDFLNDHPSGALRQRYDRFLDYNAMLT